MDITAEARKISGIARKVFEEDGHHLPMAIVMGEDKRAIIPLQPFVRMFGERWKEMASSVLQGMAADNQDILGIVMVAEAWTRRSSGPGDHVMRQLAAGEMRLSDLRPEDRQEALVVMASARDGRGVTLTHPIVREGGRASLGEPQEDAGKNAGRFGSDIWRRPADPRLN